MEGESHFWVGQCHPFQFGQDIGQFRLVRLQELASGGYVEEEVANGEVRADGTAGRFLRDQVGALDAYARAQFVAGRACAQFHLCHRSDGGQCFASEAHGAQGEEVRSLLDFRGGMAFEGQSRIGGTHAAAIVDDLHQRLAGIFNNHLDERGLGSQRVLHQLLDNRSGTLDDLAGGNLVGYGVGKQMDDV